MTIASRFTEEETEEEATATIAKEDDWSFPFVCCVTCYLGFRVYLLHLTPWYLISMWGGLYKHLGRRPGGPKSLLYTWTQDTRTQGQCRILQQMADRLGDDDVVFCVAFVKVGDI